jgi:hypothetical protein
MLSFEPVLMRYIYVNFVDFLNILKYICIKLVTIICIFYRFHKRQIISTAVSVVIYLLSQILCLFIALLCLYFVHFCIGNNFALLNFRRSKMINSGKTLILVFLPLCYPLITNVINFLYAFLDKDA